MHVVLTNIFVLYHKSVGSAVNTLKLVQTFFVLYCKGISVAANTSCTLINILILYYEYVGGAANNLPFSDKHFSFCITMTFALLQNMLCSYNSYMPQIHQFIEKKN